MINAREAVQKFSPGEVVATRGIMDICEAKEKFRDKLLFVYKELYLKGIWGILCEEDKEENERALTYGYRLLGAYEIEGIKVWMITEHDRSVTTILLPEEY